uniref:Uncharacterized protein n=1 Tax=Cacopsylla melanoneura TaxID=428564 RepID=A0A8D8SNF9_9HEMI
MKKSSVNYFGESDIHHAIRRALKRHLHNVQPTDKSKVAKKIEDNKELSSFVREFPRRSHIQKLSSFLTPLSSFDALRSHVYDSDFLTKQVAKDTYLTQAFYEDFILGNNLKLSTLETNINETESKRALDVENNKTLYADRAKLEDFILESGEEEKKIYSEISTFKQEYALKITDLESRLTSLENFKKTEEAYQTANTTVTTKLRKDLEVLDKKSVSWRTFDNYRKTHGTDFLTQVGQKEKKLKEEFNSMLEEKVVVHDAAMQTRHDLLLEQIRNELVSLLTVKLSQFLSEEAYKRKFLIKLRENLLARLNIEEIIAAFQTSWTEGQEISEDVLDKVILSLYEQLEGRPVENEIQTIKAQIAISDDIIEKYIRLEIVEELKQGIKSKIKNLIYEPLLFEKLEPLVNSKKKERFNKANVDEVVPVPQP